MGPTVHSAPLWLWGLSGWHMYKVSLDYGKRHSVGWYPFMTSVSLIFSSSPSNALLGSKTLNSKSMPLRKWLLLPNRCHWRNPRLVMYGYKTSGKPGFFFKYDCWWIMKLIQWLCLFFLRWVDWNKSFIYARQAHYHWAMSLARNFSNSHTVYIDKMCLNNVVES